MKYTSHDYQIEISGQGKNLVSATVEYGKCPQNPLLKANGANTYLPPKTFKTPGTVTFLCSELLKMYNLIIGEFLGFFLW